VGVGGGEASLFKVNFEFLINFGLPFIQQIPMRERLS
jgi:hypothetical protein